MAALLTYGFHPGSREVVAGSMRTSCTPASMHRLLPLALCSVLSAQQWTVVPAANATIDAPSGLALPGAPHAEVWQVLVDEAHLAALRGRTVAAIAMRRDAQVARTLPAVDADWVVTLGVAPSSAAAASERLADNLGARVEVFRGVVSMPSSAPPGGEPVWGPGQSFSIPLSPGFAYAGGTLAIQIEAQPRSATAVWSADAAFDPIAGVVTSLGTACGPHVGSNGRSSSVDARDLIAGNSVLFTGWGSIGAPAWLLVGARMLQTPIDLAIVGAPGCTLWVDAVAALGASFLATEHGNAAPGRAQVALPIPVSPRWLGGGLAVQWVELGAGVRTSDVLCLTTAQAFPVLGMSLVSARRGDVLGRVSVNRAPVLRVEHR